MSQRQPAFRNPAPEPEDDESRRVVNDAIPGRSDDRDFATALVDGLTARQKTIPCRFLYDAEGSTLFERITELPEYYATRTEIGILSDRIEEIAARFPDDAILVEFGSGSSRKTEILLDRLAERIAAYVPIDISPAALDDAVVRLQHRYPTLNVHPVVGDFAAALPATDDIAGRPAVGFFPGSTIGNMIVEDSIALLATMRRTLGPGSHLLVGADLRKDESVLIPAYNDASGVTAAFNLNLLTRANRELGTAFNLDLFEHDAVYDPRAGRIEMHLVSRVDQTVPVLGHRIRFRKGERIVTEHSHKYDLAGFARLADKAGWETLDSWTDAAGLFSVHLLVDPAS